MNTKASAAMRTHDGDDGRPGRRGTPIATAVPAAVLVVWLLIGAALALGWSRLDSTPPRQGCPSSSWLPTATDTAFADMASHCSATGVVVSAKALTEHDDTTYARVIAALRADTAHIAAVQNFIDTPALRDTLLSPDRKAWLLPLELTAHPDAVSGATATLRRAVAGTELTAELSGTPVTTVALQRSAAQIELLTTGITVLLMTALVGLLCRSLTAAAVNAVATAVSAAGVHVLAGLAPWPRADATVALPVALLVTVALVTAQTLQRVPLADRAQAHRTDRRRSAPVTMAMAAMAAMVVICSAVAVTGLAALRWWGSVLGLGAGVALLVSLTMVPAALTLLPGVWHHRAPVRMAAVIRAGFVGARRPAPVVLMAVVLGLAACAGLAVGTLDSDPRQVIAADAPANAGYSALADHFPAASAFPQYLVVSADHDLRNGTDLANLEQVAVRVSQLPGVGAVIGITRPAGVTLQQAAVANQAGRVGDRLDTAAGDLGASRGRMDELRDGADAVASGTRQLHERVSTMTASLRQLLGVVDDAQRNAAGLDRVSRSDALPATAALLRDSLDALTRGSQELSDRLTPLTDALIGNPACQNDDLCRRLGDDVRFFTSQNADGASALVRQLRSAADELAQNPLAPTGPLGRLREDMLTLNAGLQRLGGTDGLRSSLDELTVATGRLADGSGQLAGGVTQMVGKTAEMRSGLEQAADALQGLRTDARTSASQGFNIPATAMGRDDLKAAAALFMTPDGKTVRYLVQSASSPFSAEGMALSEQVSDVARQALPNTSLQGAQVSSVGTADTYAVLHSTLTHQWWLLLAIVAGVMAVLLAAISRKPVAALVLTLATLLSFAGSWGALSWLSLGVPQLTPQWMAPPLGFLIFAVLALPPTASVAAAVRSADADTMRAALLRHMRSGGWATLIVWQAVCAVALVAIGWCSGVPAVTQAFTIAGLALVIGAALTHPLVVPALLAAARWRLRVVAR